MSSSRPSLPSPYARLVSAPEAGVHAGLFWAVCQPHVTQHWRAAGGGGDGGVRAGGGRKKLRAYKLREQLLEIIVLEDYQDS